MALDISGLTSERLRFVPMSPDYCKDIFTEFTTEVARFMLPQPSSDIAQTEEFIDLCMKAWEAESDLEVVILDGVTSEFIGTAAVIKLKRSVPEIGIWLKKVSWGRGFATEAVRALLKWAFAYKPYPYVLYPVDRRNDASRRIAEKCGGEANNVYDDSNAAGQTVEVIEYHFTRPV